MAYQRVGSYRGRVSLQELADRLARFEVAWTPSGYGTTMEHLGPIRDAFAADVAPDLPGEWALSMLVVVRPHGGNIRMHRDAPAQENALNCDLTRYHLVLQTNEQCWNFHGGDWQQLELGGIYRIDPGQEHASINWGDTPRIHLVVDIAPAIERAEYELAAAR